MRTEQAGESALLLLDVVEALESSNVRYAVIGALAASIHGAVRASMDADAVLSAALAEAAAITQCLKTAGFQTELIRGDADDPIPAMIKVIDRHDNRVDLLVGLRGLDPEAFTRAMTVPFQGKVLKFIGREDFIAMKVFAGGPMDLLDASRAISAAGESLDQGLVRRLAQRFGQDAARALEKILKG
jgi:predicted nucleotidyltransferase